MWHRCTHMSQTPIKNNLREIKQFVDNKCLFFDSCIFSNFLVVFKEKVKNQQLSYNTSNTFYTLNEISQI